ncbi:MAG: sulfotransferase [bacterium]|nr:sulfotransferase [bacterium]
METRLAIESNDGSQAPELHLIGPLLLDILLPAAPGPLRARHGSKVLATAEPSPADGSCTLTVPLLPVPARCSLVLEQDVGSGWAPLATLAVERPALPVHPARTPQLPRPLLVTSVGRSGSTLLMQMLAAHPDIAIDCTYPYETTEARQRFVAALESAQRASRGQWDSPFRRPGWDRLLLTTVASLVRRADEESGQWYADQHRQRTGRDQLPVFYAEKNLGPATLVREARPDGREIFLVRDPRDMICSTLAFIDKRGETGFGRQDVQTDLEYVRHRAAMARPWVLEPWLARGDTAILVRYEELVRDGAGVLARIFAHLGLDGTPGTIADIMACIAAPTDALKSHMTTATPTASIGRWRTDLPPDLREACEQEFAEFLLTFGYGSD